MPNLRLGVALLVGVTLSSAAGAHSGATPSGRDEPWLVAALIAVTLVVYGLGLMRLWPHAQDRVALLARAAAFAAGCIALAVLLLGPLDAAAPRSFALHMIQHEGLMLIAAPLLVLGRGLPLFLWALPHGARRTAGRAVHGAGVRTGWNLLTAPLTAWLLHAIALWAWHAPMWFDAALRDSALHQWQHVTFLLSALLFWHAVLRRASHGAQGMALLYLFTTTIHTGVLGALLTLARRPLYASLDQGLSPYLGLTPLEDQQLGGLIMWVPGALVYVGVALWLLARWVGPERAPASLSH
jgi:putative membrane protein